MKIKELEKLVGGLSVPSKMPGFAYSTPAKYCILGALLNKKKGSVCHGCYALKGRYVFPNVVAAMERRFEAMKNPKWVDYMSDLIRQKYRKKTKADRVFRWHDSGDLQSVAHLERIVQIARNIPDIQFWLPTREREIVKAYKGAIPKNLVVRLSAAMVGQKATPLKGTVSSTVGAGTGHACPAPNQGNSCGDCRACWDKKVKSIDYVKH